MTRVLNKTVARTPMLTLQIRENKLQTHAPQCFKHRQVSKTVLEYKQKENSLINTRKTVSQIYGKHGKQFHKHTENSVTNIRKTVLQTYGNSINTKNSIIQTVYAITLCWASLHIKRKILINQERKQNESKQKRTRCRIIGAQHQDHFLPHQQNRQTRIIIDWHYNEAYWRFECKKTVSTK